MTKNTNWTIEVYLALLKAECLHSLTVFPALFFFFAESLCCFSQCSLIHKHISLMNRLFLMTRPKKKKTLTAELCLRFEIVSSHHKNMVNLPVGTERAHSLLDEMLVCRLFFTLIFFFTLKVNPSNCIRVSLINAFHGSADILEAINL